LKHSPLQQPACTNIQQSVSQPVNLSVSGSFTWKRKINGIDIGLGASFVPYRPLQPSDSVGKCWHMTFLLMLLLFFIIAPLHFPFHAPIIAKWRLQFH